MEVKTEPPCIHNVHISLLVEPQLKVMTDSQHGKPSDFLPLNNLQSLKINCFHLVCQFQLTLFVKLSWRTLVIADRCKQSPTSVEFIFMYHGWLCCYRIWFIHPKYETIMFILMIEVQIMFSLYLHFLINICIFLSVSWNIITCRSFQDQC